MDLNYKNIEEKWKKNWKDSNLYKIQLDPEKQKFYVLDMFPYPSGAGLHVGHPLGYIASDIFSRYKRLNGFNVLHPMGYDAFGLPAEQYAIQTGVHPAISTNENIEQFRKQMDNLGFSFDWSREVKTCDPKYYKWTQWIFIQMFESYFDIKDNYAKPISNLINHFEKFGTDHLEAACSTAIQFSASDWLKKTTKEKEEILMNFRLMYRKKSLVNWCEALGTVLANDEVKDGLSERGGFPVIKKPMLQWAMRTTAYAERLLDGLNKVDWPESLKTMQRNWIGKSEGADIKFELKNSAENLFIFTTRPDTIFGATFMVLAPEHSILDQITDIDIKNKIEKFKVQYRNESILTENKEMNGLFTGLYVIHPFTKKELPIWIANYVMIDYGFGAIMAVPSEDERDHRFAKKYELPIIEILKNKGENNTIGSKTGIYINSYFLNDKNIEEGLVTILEEIEQQKIGQVITNYKLRDANYSRQRYWGEPFPIIYSEEQVPKVVSYEELPIALPEVEDYKPTSDGRSPLQKLSNWVSYDSNQVRETDTMPGFAGSSWYYLRFMDPHNEHEFASKTSLEYWKDVDLYVGGAEHAVGHLLYARTWHKFLFDLGEVPTDEPFKKLINQGMLQGISEKICLIKEEVTQFEFKNSQGEEKKYQFDRPKKVFVSKEICAQMQPMDLSEMFVHINFLKDYGVYNHAYLDLEGINKFLEWRPEFSNAIFIGDKGAYEANNTFNQNENCKILTKTEVEKMSKSKFNVINPDDIISQYGADVFRMFEMFLGPIEQAKPWDIQSITGLEKFLKRFVSLYLDENANNITNNDGEPTHEDLKTLHKTIKKISEDIEKFSFNTSIAALMIAVNELKGSKCSHQSILKPLLILISPFAPFISEELWEKMGQKKFILNADWPKFDEKYLVKNTFLYPICINGKKRTILEFSKSDTHEYIKELALKNSEILKWINNQEIKKIILIPEKMVNIVI